MLFLLSLVAAVVSTGVIDRFVSYKKLQKELEKKEKLRQEQLNAREKARAQKEFVKKMKQDLRDLNKKIKEQKDAKRQAYREERERRKNIIKLPPPKKLTKAHLIRTFENMDERSLKTCRKIVANVAADPTHPRAREFNTYMDELNKIFERDFNGRTLSHTDKRFIKVAEKLFIPESGWTVFKPVKSSGLLGARYNKPKKELIVLKKRGKSLYRYHRVPGGAYVAIITKRTHAGKMGWKKGFGRGSTNPKWKGVKNAKQKGPNTNSTKSRNVHKR